ncbi:MAG: OTU domain-containing protein [Pseudomonadota bacterium]
MPEGKEDVGITEYLDDQFLPFLDRDDLYVAKDLKLTVSKMLEALKRTQVQKLMFPKEEGRRAEAARAQFFATADTNVLEFVLHSVNFLRDRNLLSDQDRRDIEFLLGQRETCLSPGDLAVRFDGDGHLVNRFNGFAESTREFLRDEAGPDESITFANRHVVAAHAMRNAYNMLVDLMGANAAEEKLAGLVDEAIENSKAEPIVPDPADGRHARVMANWHNSGVWTKKGRAIFDRALQEATDKLTREFLLKHHMEPGWEEKRSKELQDAGTPPDEIENTIEAEIERKRKMITGLYLMNSNPENLWRGSSSVNSALPQKFNQLSAAVGEFSLDADDGAMALMDGVETFITDLIAKHAPSQESTSKKSSHIGEYLETLEAEMAELKQTFLSFLEQRTSEAGGVDQDELDNEVFALKAQLMEGYNKLEVDLLSSETGNERKRTQAREMKASVQYANLQAISEAMEEDIDFGEDYAIAMFKSLLNYDELRLNEDSEDSDATEADDDDDSDGIPDVKRRKVASSDEDKPSARLGKMESEKRKRIEAQLSILKDLFSDPEIAKIYAEAYQLGFVGADVDPLLQAQSDYDNSGLTDFQKAYAADNNGHWAEVPKDGNCLFHCLATLNIGSAKDLRNALADAIRDRDARIIQMIANPALAEAAIRKDGAYVGEAAFATSYSAFLFGIKITVIDDTNNVYSINGGAGGITLARAHNHYWYFKPD